MILIYIAIIVAVFVLFVKWNQTHWQRKGIPTVAPAFFFGHYKRMVRKEISFSDANLELYKQLQKLNSQHAGGYFFWLPVYIPMQPDLIKSIIQKDFSYFTDHGLYHHPKDILTMNIFNLDGEKWKDIRAKLTPTFTSGKMKMMFETLLEKTRSLEKVVGNYAANQEAFTIKEVLGRFTTDIIASCAFGIECNSLEEPDNTFRKYGKKVVEPNVARFCLTAIIPWKLLGNLGFKGNGSEVTNFFIDIVKETIKTREVNEIYRKDFMHLLLQLKNQGEVSDSTKVNKGETNVKGKHFLSEDEIIAQCFIFFFAGFETSSTTVTFAMLELAQNLDIQEKLRREINDVLSKHDGKVTYDAIMEMRYLDNVICESLRRYPPVSLLPRICTRDYKVPNTDIVIQKGTRVQIPVWGLQMDPQYYPKPEVFDPDRFTDENKASRPDYTFLPFGEGPRMCIGLRFGMLQSKVGLVSLIKNFKFTLNKKTPLPIKMDEGSFIISVKGDIWLDAVEV